MEQAKRKIGGHGWATVIIAVLLAFLFVVEMPLSVYAESTGKGKYIKETVMITAASKTDADSKVYELNQKEIKAAEDVKKANESKPEGQKDPVPEPKTYYLFDKPIYVHDNTETYIAYTTTNNIRNSVKSIKTMNMKGGWSYTAYNDYLQTLIDQTTKLAQDLYEAVKEYATHLKAGKDNALHAKTVLEYLYEDDTHLNVSDYFVYLADKNSFEAAKNELVTFLMQANKDILVTVESALMIACKDSYVSEGKNDVSIFTGMQLFGFLSGLDGYRNNENYAYLDVYVQDLLNSLPQVQEDIRFYLNSEHMLEDEVGEMAMMMEDAVLSNEPENTEQYFEIQKEVREEMKAEFSEEELQLEESVESFEVYYNRLSLEDKNHYNNGKLFYNALSECQYTGYLDSNNKPQYDNLLGLFMLYEGTTEEISKQYSNDDFYPFLIKLSNGQRALLKIGLSQLLLSVLTPVDVMENSLNNMISAVNESAETEAEEIHKNQMVSVYKDVDRTLFQANSGIALTSRALEAAQSTPIAHVVTDAEKADLICTILSIASGCTAALSLISMAGSALNLQVTSNLFLNVAFSQAKAAAAEQISLGLKSFEMFGETFQVQVSKSIYDAGYKVTMGIEGNFASYTQSGLINENLLLVEETGVQNASVSFSKCLKTFIRMGGVGTLMAWITAISIGVMIISILVKYIYPLIHKEKDEPYIDIPRVMCSYEEVYGQTKIEGVDPVQDYIYYYGMKNPFLTDADNTRANTRDGKEEKDTNIKKYMIGDVANWTLKGLSRQWIAVYTTTDAKAGKPILANSLTVVTDVYDFSKDYDLIPVIKFHENVPFDFNAAYAVTVKEDLQPVYLAYKFDKNATTTGTAQTASVFSSITLWGGIATGLVLGGGLGAFITYSIIRKRKMKTA